MGNRREVVDKEEESSVIPLLKQIIEKLKNWKVRIKKLSKNLSESEMKEFIIDRRKSPQEIDKQMGLLACKFLELEQKIPAPLPDEDEFHEFEYLGDKPPESDDSAEVKIPPIINCHKRKEERKRIHLMWKLI